jgi:hypothetical protein
MAKPMHRISTFQGVRAFGLACQTAPLLVMAFFGSHDSVSATFDRC